MLSITQVNSQADIVSVAQLAHEIWNSHYPPIIGQQQVDYMLENFQSMAAIEKQIAAKVKYYLAKKAHQAVGYFAITSAVSSSLQISKLYIKYAHQRMAIGSQIINFIEDYCLHLNIQQVWLTVNRNNQQAIQFYRQQGFCTGINSNVFH